MKLRAALLFVMLSLSGCSAMDVISLFKPSQGLSVDTEIVVGDKEIATEVTGKKVVTTNTAESINQTSTTVNESDNYIPWIIALIGFMLPTPTRIYYLWKNRGKK